MCGYMHTHTHTHTHTHSRTPTCRHSPPPIPRWQSTWTHVLVDELQDASKTQLALLQLLHPDPGAMSVEIGIEGVDVCCDSEKE